LHVGKRTEERDYPSAVSLRPLSPTIRINKLRNLSYKDRLENCNLVKARIFNEIENKIDNSGIKYNNRSSKRMNGFWRTLKLKRKNFRKTIEAIAFKKKDCRPYAEVQIEGENVLGLLDSGAQVSCLGSSMATKFMDDSSKSFKAIVTTADGKAQHVVTTKKLSVRFP